MRYIRFALNPVWVVFMSSSRYIRYSLYPGCDEIGMGCVGIYVNIILRTRYIRLA